MKTLICSDSHTRLDYFQEVLNLEKPELVIFAGDHSTDAIDMSYLFDYIPFIIVKGNTDYYDYHTKEKHIFELDGKKVLLTHGHLHGVKMNLKELEMEATNSKVDICIFGHTHIPFHVENNGITFLNPGALMDKKYVIYENGNFFHKNLK